MEFKDKTLKCRDCGKDFVFTAGEQLFFREKQFHNAPKRCKACKLKHGGGSEVMAETQMHCSVCEQETHGSLPSDARTTGAMPVLFRSESTDKLDTVKCRDNRSAVRVIELGSGIAFVSPSITAIRTYLFCADHLSSFLLYSRTLSI